jgi:AraC-like DNA-binding protein
MQAAKESRDLWHAKVVRLNEELLKKMGDEGAVITPAPDLASFKQRLKPIYGEFRDVIGQEFFDSITQNDFSKNSANILLLDQSNQLITSCGEAYVFDDLLRQYLNTEESQYSRIITAEGTKLLLSVVRSGETGWKYVSLTPIREALREAYGAQINLILIVLLLFSVGSVIIFYNMKANYQPIYRLKNYASEILQGDAEKKNEFNIVMDAIDYLSNQNKRLIADTKNASKDFILEGLLKGKFKDLEDLNAQGSPFGITYDNDFYAVIAVMFHSLDVADCRTSPEAMYLLDDAAGQLFNGYVKDYIHLNKAVIIAAFGAEELDSVQEQLNTLQMLIRKNLNDVATIGVGNTYSDVRDIPLSYVQASAALDYRLIKGNGKIIFYHEAEGQEDSLDSYPHKELATLKYLIKQGNAEKVESVLNNIIGYINTCNIPLFIARGLCFDMVNTIWRSFEEVNQEIALPKSVHPNADILAKYDTIADLTEVVKNTCYNLCNFVLKSKAAKEQSIISDMIAYIEKNYQDSNFSIQSMADSFGMTLTNASQYFKNHTGQTIIDHTTNLRIKKSKDLISFTDMNLNEISTRVGYLNTSSFIRRFKQITGLTPGQYAKEHKKEGHSGT